MITSLCLSRKTAEVSLWFENAQDNPELGFQTSAIVRRNFRSSRNEPQKRTPVQRLATFPNDRTCAGSESEITLILIEWGSFLRKRELRERTWRENFESRPFTFEHPKSVHRQERSSWSIRTAAVESLQREKTSFKVLSESFQLNG